MLTNNSNRCAKHRFLIFLYLSCLILSLAPTSVAPPERNFSQGQPELQQSMDNMVTHGILIKKNHDSHLNKPDYPTLLTSKTSNLLAEAENILEKLPNSNEKNWVRGFVNRMRAISSMLEKTAVKKNENQNSVSGTPVLEGLPLQPTWPATSAVPGVNPFQKPSRMISKFPVTSPELSKVLPANEYPTENLAVTKPASISSNKENEDDELVRELESLHKENEPQVISDKAMVLDNIAVITTPSTPESETEGITETNASNLEAEKLKLKSRLIQEIAQFQQMGGDFPNELINALHEDEKVKSDFQNPNAVSNENETKEDASSKAMNQQLINEETVKRMYVVNSDDKHMPNPNDKGLSSEGNILYRVQQPLRVKPNLTFQSTHEFLPNDPNQMKKYLHQTVSKNDEQLSNDVMNIQNPQNFIPFNFHENHFNGYPKIEQVTHIPDVIKQRIAQKNYMAYRQYMHAYNNYLSKHRHGPNFFMHQNKTSILNRLPMVSPYMTNPYMTHQIDTQLNDDMKRQLRDGKIIVLSDSVVRSNFEQNHDNEGKENGMDKPKPEPIDKNNNDTEVQN